MVGACRINLRDTPAAVSFFEGKHHDTGRDGQDEGPPECDDPEGKREKKGVARRDASSDQNACHSRFVDPQTAWCERDESKQIRAVCGGDNQGKG